MANKHNLRELGRPAKLVGALALLLLAAALLQGRSLIAGCEQSRQLFPMLRGALPPGNAAAAAAAALTNATLPSGTAIKE